MAVKEMVFNITAGESTVRVIYCLTCKKQVTRLDEKQFDRIKATTAVDRHTFAFFKPADSHEIVTINIRNGMVTEGVAISGDSIN